MTVDQLLAHVTRAFEGDADAAEDAFAPDAVLVDQPGDEPVEGVGAIVAHFLDYGGRRERFDVLEAVTAPEHVTIRFVLRFQSDSVAYGQHGTALLALRDGLIHRWDGVWVQLDEDKSAWGEG